MSECCDLQATPLLKMSGMLTQNSRKHVILSRSSSHYPSSSWRESDTSSPSPPEITISPVLLWVIVILALVFFLFGALHLLLRLFTKKQPFPPTSQSNRYSEISRAPSLRRQLQQLFRLHDSGLDQSFINTLPVFYYNDILGLKEPFDCAVCLCEFSPQDKLRLIPICSHAFHTQCIDTWLLSNSTCPLCRANLSSGLPMEIPSSNHTGHRDNPIAVSSSTTENEIRCDEKNLEKRALSVRLGKLKSFNGLSDSIGERSNGGETSKCNLDARRCFSMGSFQYVVIDSDLQVGLFNVNGRLYCGISGDNMDGRKISSRIKGESFSVSKVWLWSKKGSFQACPSSEAKIEVPGV